METRPPQVAGVVETNNRLGRVAGMVETSNRLGKGASGAEMEGLEEDKQREQDEGEA